MSVRLALVLALASATPLWAQSLGNIVGHWRTDTASMAAGGTPTPASLLGEVRPEYPTSLALKRRPEIAVELVSATPFAYVHGNRAFAEMRVDRRQMRAVVPLGEKVDRARWWLGRSLGAISTDVYYRDRWMLNRADADGSMESLALAWTSGPWTVGAARHDADISGVATGDSLANLLGARRGEERADFGWDARTDTLGAQYQSGGWLAGAQVSEGEDTARIALTASGEPFAGVFATQARTVEAWCARGTADERWFGYAICTDLDPASSAIASGNAIRGRVALSGDTAIMGVGRRRSTPRGSEHLELAWLRHSLDLTGRVSNGALGSLDGQISGGASAEARTIAARWGRTRNCGDWRWTLAASAMHSNLEARAHAIDSPGPFRAPDWEWGQRLIGGEAWLGSLTLGLGREIDGWQVDAQYTLLGGDASGQFENLSPREPPASAPPSRPGPPPDPPTGPSPTLDLGWAFSLRVSREL